MNPARNDIKKYRCHFPQFSSTVRDSQLAFLYILKDFYFCLTREKEIITRTDDSSRGQERIIRTEEDCSHQKNSQEGHGYQKN